MPKKKKRDSPISVEQEWAQRRNRAKGQFAYALGTVDSVLDLLDVLTVGETNTLKMIRSLLEDSLEDWTRGNSSTKTAFVEKETT
jgi:hypothetical protein